MARVRRSSTVSFPNFLQVPCLPLLAISWWGLTGPLVQVALLQGVLHELRKAGTPSFHTDV